MSGSRRIIIGFPTRPQLPAPLRAALVRDLLRQSARTQLPLAVAVSHQTTL
jgi:hypothetical protein